MRNASPRRSSGMRRWNDAATSASTCAESSCSSTASHTGGAQLVEDRHPEQEVARAARQHTEELLADVVDDDAVVAGELGRRRDRIVGIGEHEGRQVEPDRPALGARPAARRPRTGERHPGRLEQRAVPRRGPSRGRCRTPCAPAGRRACAPSASSGSWRDTSTSCDPAGTQSASACTSDQTALAQPVGVVEHEHERAGPLGHRALHARGTSTLEKSSRGRDRAAASPAARAARTRRAPARCRRAAPRDRRAGAWPSARRSNAGRRAATATPAWSCRTRRPRARARRAPRRRRGAPRAGAGARPTGAGTDAEDGVTRLLALHRFHHATIQLAAPHASPGAPGPITRNG